MKQIILLSAIVVFSLNCFSQETQLAIGIPDGTVSGGLEGIDISTAEIDSVLRRAPGLGSNPTRDLANDAFDRIESLNNSLDVTLKEILDDVPDIGNSRVDTGFDPLELRLSVKGVFRDIRIDGAVASVRADINYPSGYGWVGLFCWSPSASLKIKDISLKTRFRISDGTLSSSEISYNISDFDLKCSGLSSVIDWLLEAILDEEELIDDELISDFVQELEMDLDRTTLAMGGLFSSLKTFADRVEKLNPGAASAIYKAYDMLLAGNTPTDGLQIDLLLSEQPQSIRLTASHNPSSMNFVKKYSTTTDIDIYYGRNTEIVDVYFKMNNSGYVKVGETQITGSSFPQKERINAPMRQGSGVLIARSASFGDLYSFPEPVAMTYADRGSGNCGRNRSIRC